MKSLLARMALVGAIILPLVSAANATVCSDIKAKCYTTCGKLLHARQCDGACNNEYRACVKSGSNSNSAGGQSICNSGNKAADSKCNQGRDVRKGGSTKSQ